VVEPSDQELAEAAREGASEAFRGLVERHQRGVLALCLRYAGDRDEAEDLAQQAFVRAWQSLPQYRGEGSVRGWLYRIAINLAKNRLRNRGRWAALEQAEERLTAEAEGPQRLLRAERRGALLQAIAGLPERQRQVVELRALRELSFREVAQVLGGTENAAKVNYHYALKHLRGALAPGRKEPTPRREERNEDEERRHIAQL